MLLTNSKKFNFGFFLSNRKEVKDLEVGAIENGGATKINGKVYSNIEGNEIITLNRGTNTLSVYVPDTINVNQKVDNEQYIKYSIDYIQKIYSNNIIAFEKTQGSWYSQDLKRVVYDNITIVSVSLESVNDYDINNFVKLAKHLKNAMSQECVSIGINKALAIV